MSRPDAVVQTDADADADADAVAVDMSVAVQWIYWIQIARH